MKKQKARKIEKKKITKKRQKSRESGASNVEREGNPKTREGGGWYCARHQNLQPLTYFHVLTKFSGGGVTVLLACLFAEGGFLSYSSVIFVCSLAFNRRRRRKKSNGMRGCGVFPRLWKFRGEWGKGGVESERLLF